MFSYTKSHCEPPSCFLNLTRLFFSCLLESVRRGKRAFYLFLFACALSYVFYYCTFLTHFLCYLSTSWHSCYLYCCPRIHLSESFLHPHYLHVFHHATPGMGRIIHKLCHVSTGNGGHEFLSGESFLSRKDDVICK